MIIEDDKRLANLIADVLSEEHIRVDVCHDGNEGLEMALSGKYDVAVIDWMLPGRDGPSICRNLRSAHIATALVDPDRPRAGGRPRGRIGQRCG